MSLLQHFRGQEGRLAAIAALAVMNGLLPAALVVMLKRSLDALVDDRTPATPALLALVVLALVTPILRVGRTALSRGLVWQQVHHLRLRLHERIHRRGWTSTGDGIAALTDEVEALQLALAALITALRAPLSIVALTASAVWMAPQLAIRVAFVAPLLVGVAWIGSLWTRRLTTDWRIARSELLDELVDQLNGRQTTLDHGALGLQLERAGARSDAERRARTRLDWGRGLPGALLQALVLLTIVGLLASTMDDLASGRLGTGDLVAFTTALGLLRDPVVRTAEIWMLHARAVASLARVDAVLAGATATAPETGGQFVLREVAVEGRLEPVSLDIRRGEKVAVVGASGAGKSTLLGVLAGATPDGGTLQRERTVLCRQEPWIFRRTLRENLDLAGASGSADTTLQFVGLDHLTDRLDTMAGEQGTRLSGGERQRLALARALRVEGAALLLDEATSEVEPALAGVLARRLASLDRTVVFATHEPWFPAVADRVVWLASGRLVGEGSHTELLGDPDYAALWGHP